MTEKTEEKPPPATSSATLCRQRAERAEQKRYQPLVARLAELLPEGENAIFELADALRLGLGKGGATEEHGEHELIISSAERSRWRDRLLFR